ncbi:Alpha/Beta hydrolase protein [Aspergillus alliaceus]|uniref:Alpha/Beta hydrolase protein n=1 Tax=Petromyces alliaceus TaxID=209559 RepID=UPI0012A4A3B5|nr:Alpha/Beta hydrolase protein [Aspergillus alliaceus]KAB8235658.1 Alpha/Beta hydrolase protein [Aspergillus alliaceus]
MLVFAPVLLLGLIARSVAGPVAHTSNGDIVGHSSPVHPEVTEYLGIPYAAPPVGELRFEPPQAYHGRPRYVASRYVCFDCPYTAMSTINYPHKTPQFNRIMNAFTSMNNNNSHSEDCLTLNVWNKYGRASTLKPVLVHFHGGRWTSGTTNTPYYDGANLASTEDIIVVTATYRMNVFGFPGIPGKQSNLGLLDQRKAVEWVRDNIKAFGGDPDRITMSGQSCGSAAADYWAYSYRNDPIVAGFISHSGTAESFPANSPELSAQHWKELTSLLGCNSGDVLRCMKKQNMTSLLNASGKIKPPASSSAARTPPAFQPTVDNVTVLSDYQPLARAGKFARIPYLAGHNHNEAGFYMVSAWAKGSLLPESEWQAFNKETFTCPTDDAVMARIRAGVPAWRFRYFADWDNTRLHPTSGAYHGVELNMIFGDSKAMTHIPESAPQLQLQKKMQQAWAAFVLDPRHGLEKLGWPQFSLNESTLISLGENNTPDVKFTHPSAYNAECWNTTA